MFKHSYMVVTTNFDLDAVLRKYLETYPKQMIENYQIVFQSDTDCDAGEMSYMVVFTRNEGFKGRPPVSVWEYIMAYCQVNNRYAIAAKVDHIFPQKRTLQGMSVAGNVSQG